MNARAEFAAAQAAMTRNWGDNVFAREGGDVEAYFELRRRAYLKRWGEALPFVPPGAALLDLGGGNLFPALFDVLRAHGVRTYDYMDVDPAAVEGSRALALAAGCDPARIIEGFNDELPYPDACFEAVFSSHCIEHSFDLDKTFTELRRVLKPGGVLLMAVPFGWELNPEHPYFFGPDEWAVLVEDHGFSLRAATIGNIYPENGSDYFIAAERTDAPAKRRRLSAAAYRKQSYSFLPFTDARFEYHGDWDRKPEHAIGMGPSSVLQIKVPAGVSEVWPIVARHDWSGVAGCAWGKQELEVSLFSRISYVQPFRLSAPAQPRETTLTLKPLRAEPCGWSAQVVVHGMMFA